MRSEERLQAWIALGRERERVTMREGEEMRAR